MARLFLAAWPPDHVVEELARQLPRPPTPGVRWVDPGAWHVTLRFLGRCEPEAAQRALAVLAAPPAEAVLGPRVVTLGRSVVCVPVAGLDALADAVRAATADVGQPPDPRPFTGHLTLARRRGRTAVPALGQAVAGRFAVEQVVLVESRTEPAGATYHPLAVHPLTSGDAR